MKFVLILICDGIVVIMALMSPRWACCCTIGRRCIC